MHLADWVVTAVAGPVLVLVMVAAGAAVIRTRTNAHRLRSLEADMGDLKNIPERLAELRSCLRNTIRADSESTRRNDKDHTEIKAQIRDNKADVMHAIRQMKADLIREFRNNNGKK